MATKKVSSELHRKCPKAALLPKGPAKQTNSCISTESFGMRNEVNLCDSCRKSYPECATKAIICGTGVGNDNIVACPAYEPLMARANSVTEVNK